ncbi:hypothetical protein D3C76_1289860 [compost metagenome]
MKPVLIKIVRSFAAAIQFFKFTDVRRSSSIIPIFNDFAGNPIACSARSNNSTANATSSGPCIFGLTIYIEPLREFLFSFSLRISATDNNGVTNASIIPSKISSPSTKIAGLVIK